MKTIVLLLVLGISSDFGTDEKTIETWVQEIVEDMIQLNDLRKYSHKEIPPEITVNFMLVEAVKDVNIANGLITMRVDHGTGKYCSALTFRYVKKDGTYYLVFDVPTLSSILGTERKFVNPWVAKKKVCS